jgi:hypothetical protein
MWMMIKKIQVSTDDINHGEPYSLTHTPVALAARRELGGYVLVGGYTMYWYDPEQEIKARLPLPASVITFNTHFDESGKDGDDVRPFEFEVETAYANIAA